MKKPNFFIIGAPKCGTTSLASWLSEHPSIYMSPVKEPHHYCSDFYYKTYRDWSYYLTLFEDANKNHLAVGEASVWYLLSKNAVPKIEEEIVNAKYIVLLRNPLDMAPSLHQQLLFSGAEHIKSFEQAWKLQNDRAKGKHITRSCREPRFLLYREACSLGAQMERLFTLVPRERILPLLLDDIKADSRAVWLDVLSFLGVPDDGRTEFPVKNRGKEKRFMWLRHAHVIYSHILRRFNLRPLGTGILTFLDKKNTRERPRDPLSPQMRQVLVESFEDDIRLLAKLLDRDLEHWLS